MSLDELNSDANAPDQTRGDSSGEEANPGLLGVMGRIMGPAIAALILLTPSPEGLAPSAQRLLAVTIWMAIWWVTQAIPIAATSLMPLAMFPLLGIQSAKTVGQSYLGDTSFLYLGGFMIALGIERWNLHRRLALLTVSATGTSPRRIVLGFMLATFSLSMWISNTATTLLMLPIAVALLNTLEQRSVSSRSSAKGVPASVDPQFAHLATSLTLGIAYAASIGGLATLVGTPTNLAFVEIWNKSIPGQPAVSASQWMLTWTPFGIVFLICAWQVLVWGLKPPVGFERFDRKYFRDQLRDLGAMSFAEIVMLILFAVTAMLWLFRTDFTFGDVVLVRGWGGTVGRWLISLGVPKEKSLEFVSDATVAMVISILMFVIPVRRARTGSPQYLMDWATTSRIPWGILLLFGGGFAIAGAFESTKLSEWVGGGFKTVGAGQPTWVLIAAVCTLLTFLTEFTSNVATVNTVLPIIAAASLALEIDPRLLMIPATISASCAFMLPIGTPPNAIVFATGRIKMSQMASYGLILNLLGIVLAVAAVYGLMIPQLGIQVK
ncbi:SLC13 family permease [Schlesneria paludicola]|uniref:SLC13 family permease n=1 Tax=Schlesneria paludicola TaxID=360056 RepID=UPI0012FB2BFD|nr:SLC13 family permease [Schlesneria paludicola]